VATHWLGDTFWALQVIPFLQQRFPASEIYLLVRPENEWLARLWLPAQQVQVVTGVISDRQREGTPSLRQLWREATRLRRLIRPIDGVIDLTGTPSSALLTRFLRPGFSLGLRSNSATRFLYQQSRPARLYTGHLAGRPWYLLAPWMNADPFWPDAKQILSPKMPEALEMTSRPAPADHQATRAALIPGAGWPEKRWPAASYQQLAKRLEAAGWRVSILVTSSELSQMVELKSIESERIRLFTPTGEEMMNQLNLASIVVANDSGPAHLSAAIGKPTIAIFGPTNPSFCRPLGTRTLVLRTSCGERPEGDVHHCHNRPAYPCSEECLASVTVEMVWDAIHNLIDRPL